ncbi:hypothetical protein F7725_009330, partial [Dissostichus mawsoni]
MTFRKALKHTAMVGGGAVATVFGLSQLIEYRKTQARLAHVAAEAELRVPFADEFPSRQAQLAALQNTEEFDVLVVGGATGAGCALDAVTRKRSDFSSGTSSRSTKLLHGGVRYLQKAIMQLDYEQVPLHPPTLHFQTVVLLFSVFIFLCMYDLVAGAQCLKSSYVLSKAKALEHFPMLKKDKLVGAIVYYDGQHNDARMNLAIALSSVRYGAAVANYTEVMHLLKTKDPQSGQEKVCGARCRDFDVKAKCVINATGPFTDSLRKMDNQETKNICQPSAGVHIVIPGYYSPDNMGLLDPATSDGRIIFFLPWEKMTIAGTTDSPTSVTAHPIPGEDDINFILREIRNYLSPDVEGDVLAAWSGIRPLVTDPDSKDTQSICRNHIVAKHLAATYGGKAFDVAKMAQVTGQRWPIVLYAVREYACTATDVIARRTRLGFLNVQAAGRSAPSHRADHGEGAGLERGEEDGRAGDSQEVSVPGDGYRSRAEQLTKTTEINLDTQEVARYKKRFHKFDKESKGFITTVDVQQFWNINVQIDENALHEILNEVDLNKNGQVEIDEFMQLMSAVKKGQVSDSRLAILMKTAEETLNKRGPVTVDRSGGDSDPK